MAFKLTVRCHGIIVAVQSTDKDHVALLLPKGSRDLIEDQAAYVRFPASSYSRKNQRHPADVPSPEGNQHIFLRKERLTIDAGAVSGLTFTSGRDETSKTPTGSDHRSLDWMPNLGELAADQASGRTATAGPPPGAIDDDYFLSPDTVEPKLPALLARIDFTSGVLSTSGVDPVQVHFKTKDDEPKRSPRTPFRRAMARELVLELEIPGNSFTLVSERFDGTPDPENSMLFEVSDGKAVEIVVGNESAADIHRVVRPMAPLDVIAGQCMYEFELYFRMCAVEPSEPLFPHLSSRPGEGTCCSNAIDPHPSDKVKYKPTSPVDLERVAPVQAPPWTALAYIAADNSLSKEAEDDLEQLEQVTRTRVVAQIDRPGGRGTERLILKKGRFVLATRERLGNLSSGKPQFLTDFLRAGKAATPGTRHYAVFFLTHGSGLLDFTFERLRKIELLRKKIRHYRRHAKDVFYWRGKGRLYSNPDFTDLDFLDNGELSKALVDALDDGEQFAIIGFDSCVMGLVELAYQVREAGRFYVASQDDVRAQGWSYSNILNSFTNDTTPEEATRIIVQAYRDDTREDDLATLSVVDLSQIEKVTLALDRLGELLHSGQTNDVVSTHIQALAHARNDARAFSNFHYIDLYGFVRAIKTRLSESMGADPRLKAIREASDDVLKAIDAAVVETSKKDREKSGAHGLSVYVPNSEVAKEYHDLAMSKKTSGTRPWHNFVVAYANARMTLPLAQRTPC